MHRQHGVLESVGINWEAMVTNLDDLNVHKR